MKLCTFRNPVVYLNIENIINEMNYKCLIVEIYFEKYSIS